MKPVNKIFSAMAFLGILSLPAMAITANELANLMEQKVSIALIDVRDASLFQQGHIPGAINVPIRVLPFKKLPPLGRVVVYGRGLGQEDMEVASYFLNEKQGIDAEVLEGGYAAWETSLGMTTQAAGLHKGDTVNMISYQDLQDLHAADGDVVLVDLRMPPPLSRQGVDEENQLVSLTEKFPGKAVVKSPFEVAGVPGSGKLARQSDKPLPLMVLIDDGDGKAQEMARMLKANGLQRGVVLAGGERILERDGAPGLQRMGLGTTEAEKYNASK
jgi:rhodanese-related sulfurtransferase